MNQLSIKLLPGRKSDEKDAEWIVTCLRKNVILQGESLCSQTEYISF